MKGMRMLALASAMALGVAGLSACAVARDQQSAGEYVDDAAITAKIKAAFAEDKTVAATAISVETLNGEVQLTGFAKSEAERSRAAELAKRVAGVRAVKNAVAVRN